jgi:uncharacterized protein (TIGR03083 family)
MTYAAAPGELRAETIRRALERRPAGRPVNAVDPCTPLKAFHSAVAQLYEMLSSLGADDWRAVARDGIGTVGDVVVHLVGVERLVLGWLSAPEGEEQVPTEHVAAARAASGDLRTSGPEEVAALWFDTANAVYAACAVSDPGRAILFHDLPMDVDGLLVARAFELWAHLHDVCTAVGRRVPALEEPRLALMSSRMMALVPVALTLRGANVAVSRVRFVLTGEGGGCYDLVIDPKASPVSAITIVADVVDVCRVAARRLSPGDLNATVEGDVAVACAIIESLDAFARD